MNLFVLSFAAAVNRSDPLPGLLCAHKSKSEGHRGQDDLEGLCVCVPTFILNDKADNQWTGMLKPQRGN